MLSSLGWLEFSVLLPQLQRCWDFREATTSGYFVDFSLQSFFEVWQSFTGLYVQGQPGLHSKASSQMHTHTCTHSHLSKKTLLMTLVTSFHAVSIIWQVLSLSLPCSCIYFLYSISVALVLTFILLS